MSVIMVVVYNSAERKYQKMFFNLFKRQEEMANNQAKQDLDSTFFSMKVKQLPQNFAQMVMDLEMKLSFIETYDIQAVKQLNELYRHAIEFYIHEDPKKAKHFQRKLTSLLSNPQTLLLFDQKKKKPKQQSYQKNLRNQIGAFQSQSATLVTQMIEGSDKQMQKRGRMVNMQINDQESRLKNRLEHRSNSRQARRQKPFLSP